MNKPITTNDESTVVDFHDSGSETERAIARVREAVASRMIGVLSREDVVVLVAEHDRLKAELDRLTTPQEARDHDGNKLVLLWEGGHPFWTPADIRYDVKSWQMWTPLPTPRPKEADKCE